MTYSYPGDAPDQSGSKIFNNLYDGSATFVTGKLSPWLSNNIKSNIQDIVDSNYIPKKNSIAVNGGIKVTGINIPYQGTAPYVGAYEYLGEYWKPGCDLDYK
jgi:hypothetical protein